MSAIDLSVNGVGRVGTARAPDSGFDIMGLLRSLTGAAGLDTGALRTMLDLVGTVSPELAQTLRGQLGGLLSPVEQGQVASAPTSTSATINVRRGDTLSAIAARAGVSLDALLAANPQFDAGRVGRGDRTTGHQGRDPDRIAIGDRITLPGGAAARTQADRIAPPVETGSTQAPRNGGPLEPGAASVRAAEQAESRVRGRASSSECYRYVKQALQRAGAVSDYMPGVAAQGAGPALEARGFTNILQSGNIRSPYDAPVGAVLVYGAAPGATDRNARYGHIEIRTPNGFASDYFSARARTGDAAAGLDGRGRVLIGVYVKPDAGALQRPDAVAPTTPGAPAAPNDLIARLGSVISRGEGNYDSYNSGTRGVAGGRVGHSFVNPPAGSVTNRTINEILATDRLSGTDPNRMFATGKYQTTIPTLRAARDALGLTGNERYTPELQERIFREFLLDKAGGGVLAAFVRDGRGSIDAAQFAAAQEWASIAVPAGMRIGRWDADRGQYVSGGPVSDGRMSYYQRAGTNSASMSATNALRELLVEINNSRAAR
jgi:LysM domain